MSEGQKVFTSVAGTVIVHVLLLLFVFLFLTASNHRADSLRNAGKEGRPEEVTIMLSEFLENLETVEPEPIPEEEPTPEPQLPEEKAFLNTDMNTPSAERPEYARFESDRNTLASSKLAPDTSKPQVEGPTLKGDLPVDILHLNERNFIDGEFEKPAGPPAAQPGQQDMIAPPSEATPSESEDLAEETAQKQVAQQGQQEGEMPPDPSEKASEGKDADENEGTADQLPVRPAEELSRPEAMQVGNENREAESEKSFVDPLSSSSAATIHEKMGEKDQDAMADALAEKTGEVTDPEQMRQKEAVVAKETEEVEEQRRKLADSTMFADGFSPEEHQNTQNGSNFKIGEDGVDAEESAVGKYKKAVSQAISRKWHRYREKNAEFVSWGTLKIEFNVDRAGRVKDLKIVENNSNAIIAEFSLKAIREADIPPMPEEVSSYLGIGGLEMKYNIIIY